MAGGRPIRTCASLCEEVLLIQLFILLLFFLPSCGIKAPPTLKSYEKPEAPSALNARHKEGDMILSWTYPDNLRKTIKGFEILRSKGDVFVRIGTAGKDEGSFTDPAFEVNRSYIYKVIARNQRGIPSADSNLITVTPRPLPPPPAEVSFAVRPDVIELSWSSSGDGVCYHIYRTQERGNYSGGLVNREPLCELSFKDPYLSPDNTVYYTIRALHATAFMDEGYPSREIGVEPSYFIPSPPSDLRFIENDGRISLLWKESPESWVKGYRVYKKGQESQDFTLIGETRMPAFTDREGAVGRTWYMVRAAGPAGLSGPVAIEVVEGIER
jgi:fibronectin type 3 domain-containing protein